MGSRMSEKYYQVVKSKNLVKKKRQEKPFILEVDKIGKIGNTEKESFKTYVPMGLDNLSYDA